MINKQKKQIMVAFVRVTTTSSSINSPLDTDRHTNERMIAQEHFNYWIREQHFFEIKENNTFAWLFISFFQSLLLAGSMCHL